MSVPKYPTTYLITDLTSSSYPNEKTRSASSMTNISKDCLILRLPAWMCAKIRVGVPITMSGFSINLGL